MLRYYSWLPVLLEEEYQDGYTCDNCGKDFLEGPFFHQDTVGLDYCVPCGTEKGYTVFRGTGTITRVYFFANEYVAEPVALSVEDARRRFPWLTSPIFTTFDRVIELHPPCLDSVSVGKVCVSSFDADGSYGEISLNNGVKQVFDSTTGVEVILKNDVPIAALRNCTPWKTTLAAVQQTYTSIRNALTRQRVE